MYLIGAFRRTALWCIIFTVLGSIAISADLLNFLGVLIVIYAFTLLLHLLVCKFKDKNRSFVEAFLSSLLRDLAAPFSKFSTFLAVITRRWVIQDDSKFHNIIDALQVVSGGIWSIIVFGVGAFLLVNIIL
ncbi:MAG TPA: hypothetical protein H9754_11330 [Candidatus Anaerostipes avistercoris]|uniref:Uncharacterized protein n=1 Tax=Candidatus Anaerostipes avistercoris TaxID=2838462 RepID=A0A9D2TAJ4_9FIRM|nr:hypothetical protein [Candidatus Anaerostipes avistercoris]